MEGKIIDYIIYAKELLLLITTITALIVGYKLSRKIKENYNLKLIDDLYLANKEVKREILPLIDKYSVKANTLNIISKEEVENLLTEIQNLQNKTIHANSQSISIIFLLKRLIQNLLRNLNQKDLEIRTTTNDLYGIVLLLLADADYFATYVVNIKTFKFHKEKYARKELREFCLDYNLNIFDNPPQALLYSPFSVITLKFFQTINKVDNYIIRRSAYQIYNHSKSIIRLLYLEKIYFPIVLRYNSNEIFLPKYYLVGYTRTTILGIDEDQKTNVKLTYSNLIDDYSYEDTSDNYEKDLIDGYLSIKINWLKLKEKYKKKPETLEFIFEEEYLNELFNQNVRLIRNKMKEEIIKKSINPFTIIKKGKK